MSRPFIIFLKNKTSHSFEYAKNVSKAVLVNKIYRITFYGGKTYNYGTDKVEYYPLNSTRENVRIYEKGRLNNQYDTVDDYGKYLIFRKGNSYSNPIRNSTNIEICDIKEDIEQATLIINYFREILETSGEVSFDVPTEETETTNKPKQISTKILLKALENIDLKETRSVLSNYIDGTLLNVTASKKTLIYPFGCNESQKQAVETALRNSISIVEGPPGTGKTQTILNIIANLIVQKKTVAVVSNNNSAVFNVREKLEKYGYEMVVAPLGNRENKETFFENIGKQRINSDFKRKLKSRIDIEKEIRRLDELLTESFRNRNKLSTLKFQLSDTKVEFSHIKEEQPLNPRIKALLDKIFYRKLNLKKILDLKEFLSQNDIETELSFIDKLRFGLKYGTFDFTTISKYRDELSVYVNHKFYELHIAKTEAEILKTEKWLESNKEEANLNSFVEKSKEIFNASLFRKYDKLKDKDFSLENYLDDFDEFSKRYPVMLSSTLSLHASIPKGYLLDYLIIDEASQVDIIKSAVCFSCCRNVVVVGDSMQLTHIVDEESKLAAKSFQDAHNISSAYDYVKQNILNSLKTLYGNNIKTVLLKEHYRCHPTIIGFCNKKYYHNNLVVMTSGNNYPFKIIETNIAGGRGNYNQRQIDETDTYIREKYSEEDYTKIGVIAPYRDHADMLQKQLPNGVEADTIHKFQGREKDVIIFNTVRNKVGPFIDNPNLINVAVSRAVKEFIVVKPEAMELPHGTNIGDMIRYMCYTTNSSTTIIKGSICSVFDLLYKEYNKAFVSFISSNSEIEGSAAEIIMYKLLNEKILKQPQFLSIDMLREYKLKDLIRDFEFLSEEEVLFIKNNARLDFLLYNRIDKMPVLAIEVDGVSFHDNEIQQVRDSKKNHILEVIGLPLLRLSTDGHSEEKRIVEALNDAMGIV